MTFVTLIKTRNPWNLRGLRKWIRWSEVALEEPN
eukprot:SAG22_NODE_13076_length_420_cov_0.423676_1_plen_33_part_01